MKKIFISILIIVLLFNFIFVSISNATTGETTGLTQEQINALMNDGTASGKELTISPSYTGNVVGTIAGVFNVIPMVLHTMLTIVCIESGLLNMGKSSVEIGASIELEDFGLGTFFLTIEKIIFGRYFLFEIDNDIKADELYTSEDILALDIGFTEAIISLKENAYLWYYILRIIALIISLLTLIYIGIRIAISSVASEQAKYKKMFIGWIESVFLIAILPYVILIVIKLNSILVDWAVTIKDSFISNGKESFEADIIKQVFAFIKTKGGLTVALYSLMYWFLVFIQLKFFFLYIIRVFTVYFLILISPLITVTYSIDKAGDGKAQAFNNWFKEFLYTVFIQVLHIFAYLVFMFLAGNIAETVPIVGILFLYALPKIEKIIKIIFDVKNLAAIKDFKDIMKSKG